MTVLVVGNGIAGQAAAVELLARGLSVSIVTDLPASASESAARRGGFDVDDDPERHVADVGNPEFLDVAKDAHEIFEQLRHLDVPFSSTRTQSLGAQNARTALVDVSTAHHVSRRLSARLRHFGCAPREGREFVRLVLDDSNRVRGALFRNRRTGKLEAVAAEAVCLATGGYAGLFDPVHPGRVRGAALGRVFRQGALLEISGGVRLELGWDRGGVPTALPEVLFANGVMLESEAGPIEFDPKTTTFHALAVRAPRAKLVLSTADAAVLDELAGSTLAAMAGDLTTLTIPARSLGGLQVREGEATSIPGLFAVGGASARFHREKSCSGNALLVDLWAARKLAETLANESREPAEELEPALLERAEEQLTERRDRARDADGESPFALRRALAESCSDRANSAALEVFADRLRNAPCPDADLPSSPSFSLLRELEDALCIARAVLLVNGESVCVRCTDDGRLERVAAS